MALTPKDVEELHNLVKNLLENWMHIKLAIQKSFGKGAITKEQETTFLKLKSDVSRLFRIVSDRLPKDLQFAGEKMIELLKNATSMAHLQALPLVEKRNIFSTWHEIYVLLTRCFGALEVINEGYYPRLHRDLLKTKRAGKATKRPARAAA